MQKQYPISEAKNNLPAIVHGVEQGNAVQLTRHGKPVAYIVSTVRYQQLTQPHTNFWDALNSFRRFLDESDFPAENESFAAVRDQSPGRRVDLEL